MINKKRVYMRNYMRKYYKNNENKMNFNNNKSKTYKYISCISDIDELRKLANLISNREHQLVNKKVE